MSQVPGVDDARIFAPPPQQAATDTLGQEDFLTLMITQFKNQDPFKPMENGQFLGQLAQFGTVSGIEKLNGAFASLQSSIQSEQVLQAANLVGRQVLATSDNAYVAEGGTVSGAIQLGSSAANVQVEINDANGELVRRLNMGPHDEGLVDFEWDGLDVNGEPVAAGHYEINARVVHGTQVESVGTMLHATIDSVSLGQHGRGMTLNLPGGGALSIDQVRRIL